MARLIPKAISGVLLLLCFSAGIQAQTSTDFPRLIYSGVIPVQYEGSFDDLLSVKVKETSNRLFPNAVRASRRFRVINDEVVADLWSKPEGRAELVKQFELDNFLSLTLAKRGDSVLFVARLLSPDLKSYLIETDTLPRLALAEVAPEALGARIERLVFRMVNRLPVDVTVSSVQGKYITVSGGKEQGLQAGDTLTFYQTRVKSFHPANGSWLAFDSVKLSEARIVEVNKTSAVAQVTSQVKDGSVKIGDGAKVPALASRHAFSFLPKDSWEQEESTTVNPIVTPEGMDSKQQSKSLFRQGDAVAKPATPPPPQQQQRVTEAAPTQDVPKVAKSDATVEEKKADEDTADKKTDEPNAKPKFEAPSGRGHMPPGFGVFEGLADEVKVHAGYKSWSAAGYGSSSSNFPFYIANNVGFIATTTLTRPELKMDYGADLGFGPAATGSFNSLGLHGRVYWQAPLQGMDNVQVYNLGLIVKYDNLNTKGDTFGGIDVMRIGGTAGLKGQYVVSNKEAIDFSAIINFLPSSTGIMNIRKKNRQIQGGSGMNLQFSGFMVGAKRDLEWGGMFGYDAMNYQVFNKSESFNSTYIAGGARVRF